MDPRVQNSDTANFSSSLNPMVSASSGKQPKDAAAYSHPRWSAVKRDQANEYEDVFWNSTQPNEMSRNDHGQEQAVDEQSHPGLQPQVHEQQHHQDYERHSGHYRLPIPQLHEIRALNGSQYHHHQQQQPPVQLQLSFNRESVDPHHHRPDQPPVGDVQPSRFQNCNAWSWESPSLDDVNHCLSGVQGHGNYDCFHAQPEISNSSHTMNPNLGSRTTVGVGGTHQYNGVPQSRLFSRQSIQFNQGYHQQLPQQLQLQQPQAQVHEQQYGGFEHFNLQPQDDTDYRQNLQYQLPAGQNHHQQLQLQASGVQQISLQPQVGDHPHYQNKGAHLQVHGHEPQPPLNHQPVETMGQYEDIAPPITPQKLSGNYTLLDSTQHQRNATGHHHVYRTPPTNSGAPEQTETIHIPPLQGPQAPHASTTPQDEMIDVGGPSWFPTTQRGEYCDAVEPRTFHDHDYQAANSSLLPGSHSIPMPSSSHQSHVREPQGYGVPYVTSPQNFEAGKRHASVERRTAKKWRIVGIKGKKSSSAMVPQPPFQQNQGYIYQAVGPVPNGGAQIPPVLPPPNPGPANRGPNAVAAVAVPPVGEDAAAVAGPGVPVGAVQPPVNLGGPNAPIVLPDNAPPGPRMDGEGRARALLQLQEIAPGHPDRTYNALLEGLELQQGRWWNPYPVDWAVETSLDALLNLPPPADPLREANRAHLVAMFPHVQEEWLQQQLDGGLSAEAVAAFVLDPANVVPNKAPVARKTVRKRKATRPKVVDFLAEPYTVQADEAYLAGAQALLENYFPELQLMTLRGTLRMFGNNFAPSVRYLSGEVALLPPKTPSKSDCHDPSTRPKPTFVDDADVKTPKSVKIKRLRKPRVIKAELPDLEPRLKEELAWLELNHPDLIPKPPVEEDEGPKRDLLECEICCDEKAMESFRACRDGHLFCVNCIISQAQETAFGQGSLVCLDHTCELGFARSTLQELLPSDLAGILEERETEKAVAAAGVANFVRCRFCAWGAVLEVPASVDKVFRCGNAGECGRSWCRLCEKDWDDGHVGKRCEELEEDQAAAKRRKLEEALTASVLRKCHKCGLQYQKVEGCNRITCADCKATSCYLCREKDIQYDHFCGHFREPGKGCEECTKCSLWEKADRVDNETLAAVQSQAEVESSEASSSVASLDLNVPQRQPNLA